MSDRQQLLQAIEALGEDHPLAIQYEEAKRGLHVINAALAQQNMHISFLANKIIRQHNPTSE